MGSVTHCGDDAAECRGALVSKGLEEEEMVSAEEVEAMALLNSESFKGYLGPYERF